MTTVFDKMLRSPLGLGGGPIGNFYRPLDDDSAQQALDAAWDAGIRYFDTAPQYGTGLSEHRFGTALRRRPRDEFVLSTKVGRLLSADPGSDGNYRHFRGGLPFAIRFDYTYDAAMRSVEDSLQRLSLARIDIAYVHDLGEDAHGAEWTNMFAIAERGAMKALARLKAEGTISGWGLGVNRIAPCMLTLERAEPDIFLLAGRYSLLDHDALEKFMPACRARGARLVIGGAFNSGLLAGGSTYDYAPAGEAILQRVAALKEVCDGYGVDIRAAAIQFCAAPEEVAAVVVGTRSATKISENVALARVEIPAAFWAALKDRALIPLNAPVPSL